MHWHRSSSLLLAGFLALSLLSCKRPHGTWGVGVPGGFHLAAPIELSPGSWFHRNKKKPEPALSPLAKLHRDTVLPALQDPAVLQWISWLRTGVGTVDDPCVRAAVVFAALEAIGLQYETGPTEIRELSTGSMSLEDIATPGEVLGFKKGGREDLVVLMAALAHGWGAEVGLGWQAEAGLRLLIKAGEAVLVVNATSLGGEGFFAGAELKPQLLEGDYKELFWFPVSLVEKLPPAGGEPGLCQRVQERLMQPAQGELAQRVQAARISCP